MALLIPGLPDELALCIIARLPWWKFAALSGVSRGWRRTVTQPNFLALRASLGVSQSFLLLHEFTIGHPKKIETLRFVALDPVSNGMPHLSIPRPHGTRNILCVQQYGTHILVFRQNQPARSHPAGLSCFNLSTNQWDQYWYPFPSHPSVFSDRIKNCGVVLDGYLYVMHGHEGIVHRLNFGKALIKRLCSLSDEDTIIGFDSAKFANLEWECLPTLHEKERRFAALVAYDGKILVLGGGRSWSSTRTRIYSGEVWDPSIPSREWSLVPELWPHPFFSCKGTFTKKTVFIVGGQLCAVSRNIGHIVYYEDRTKEWIPCIPLQQDHLSKMYPLQFCPNERALVWSKEYFCDPKKKIAVSTTKLQNNVLGIKTFKVIIASNQGLQTSIKLSHLKSRLILKVLPFSCNL
ncbi:hypothetical protein L7F22_007173 [Adiantum nelumboides]|nr:hypothetical protein [Adiantum nelumboides]